MHLSRVPWIQAAPLTRRSRPFALGLHVLVWMFLGQPSAAQVTDRVSVGAGAAQGNASAWSSNIGCPISGEGRYIVFGSSASNLVPFDLNGTTDVFVRDRLLETTELVSISSNGVQANGWSGLADMSISQDGTLVAFVSAASNLVLGDNNGSVDVFIRDRTAGTTERVSINSLGIEGDDNSGGAFLSADGRFVVFESAATNLVPSDSNQSSDVFVFDRVAGSIERVSVSSTGVEADDQSGYAVCSADGRFVAFSSRATNLVAGDTNGTWDVFLRDRLAGTTARVSVDSSGAQALGDSGTFGISADGRWVTFYSTAPNLVVGDTNGAQDAFVHDMVTGLTERVSVSSSSAQADGPSTPGEISDDGRYVSFKSSATNLVFGDTNGASDAFLRDRLTGTTERISVSTNGTQA